jgi:hypothetical protein
MSDGRTIWWAKDAGWWRRERIVELGEEFGAAGPAVIDWLACEAKSQNDGGRVKTGPRSISRGCFVDVVTVRHVLSRSVTLCLLEDFEEHGNVLTCRISGWKSDDARARAAFRQQKKRLKDAEAEGASHALSRSVTERHAEFHREEKRREELPPSIPPLSGGRQRDKDARREWVQSVAAMWPDPPGRAEGLIWQAVAAGARTIEDVRTYMQGQVAA